MKDYLLRVRRSAAHAAYKQALAPLVGLSPGMRVLDLGCGLGDDAAAMRRAVGPGGLVVALDRDRETLRAGAPLPCRVLGDGAALPFRDASFDRVRIDRVLHLVPDPGAVLREAAAVLRPGGRLVAAEPLWSSLVCAAVEVPGAARIAALLAEGPSQGVEVALDLPRLAAAAGLAVEDHRPGHADFTGVEEAFDLLHIEGRLAAAMLERRIPVAEALGWLQAQRALAAEGRFRARMEGRTLVARRP